MSAMPCVRSGMGRERKRLFQFGLRNIRSRLRSGGAIEYLVFIEEQIPSMERYTPLSIYGIINCLLYIDRFAYRSDLYGSP